MAPLQLGNMRVHKVHEMDSPVPLPRSVAPQCPYLLVDTQRVGRCAEYPGIRATARLSAEPPRAVGA